jgi:hypothetical protein
MGTEHVYEPELPEHVVEYTDLLSVTTPDTWLALAGALLTRTAMLAVNPLAQSVMGSVDADVTETVELSVLHALRFMLEAVSQYPEAQPQS